MVDFLTINANDTKMTLVRALIGREQEIHGYDINIGNYEAMLTALPSGDWPTLVSAYRGASIDQVPVDLQETVSEYSFRDRIRSLLATEKLERSKSVRIYEALKSQIPADEIQSLVQQVLAENTAQ